MRSRDAVEVLNPFRLLAGRLIVLEHAVLDNQPLIRGNSLIVPRDARQRVRLRAIRLYVHERGSVFQLSDRLLGRRDETGARVVGLLTDGTVELRGVPD